MQIPKEQRAQDTASNLQERQRERERRRESKGGDVSKMIERASIAFITVDVRIIPTTVPNPGRKNKNPGLTKKLWLQPQAEGRDQHANANGTGVASEAC